MRKNKYKKNATASIYECYAIPSKKKKKVGQKVVLVLLVFVIVFVVVFFAIHKAKQKNEVFGDKAFFVVVGKFEKRLDAKNFADKVKGAGGAGSIIAKDKFCVVAFAYPTKSMAENVVKRLNESNWQAEILEIDIKPKSKNTTEKGMLLKLKKIAGKFFDLAIDFDKENKTEAEVQNELSKIKIEILEVLKSIDDNDNYLALKETLEDLKEEIEECQKISFAKNICSGDIKSFCIFALWECFKLGQVPNI